MRLFKLLLAVSLLPLAVHGNITPAHAENTVLTCGQNSDGFPPFSVEISPEEGLARVKGGGLPSTEIMRPVAPANGRGELYEGPTTELFRPNFDTQWELSGGDAVFPCRRASVDAGPSNYNNNKELNLVGKSLGGNLRSGPGTNFAKVGSLAEGTWLTIVRNTGVNWNGYDWFEVRLDSGKVAFLWGGIMCNNGPTQRGVYQSC